MTTTNTITILAEDIWLSEPDLRARLGFSRSTIRRLRELLPSAPQATTTRHVHGPVPRMYCPYIKRRTKTRWTS
jgi:hypothetical protein